MYQRVAHLARRSANEVKVVAPLPYAPKWLRAQRWRSSVQTPREEQVGELPVYHPRYFLLPKVSMTWQGHSMFLGSLRSVAAVHREWKIDLLDAHYVYPDGMAAALLARHLGVPFTISARGTDINLFSSFPLIRPMIQWTLKCANGVIAVSAALKKAMVQLGVDPNKIRVIPNGVDPARFEPVPAGEARRALGLAENGPMIVTVGSLIPAKGQDFVIRAFAQMATHQDGLQLFLLGEGTQRKALEGLVKELGVTSKVHLVGKRPNEELGLWFSAATVSCLASAREGWPNAVMESLACGTPVVATAVGGIPEILDSKEYGILVDRTTASVAAGLEQALTQTWNRPTIAARIRARTWDTVAEEVEDFFSVLTQSLAEGKS